MKRYFLLLLLIFVLFSIKLLAVSDTAWIKSFNANDKILESYFSKDDSIIIMRAKDSDSSGYIETINSHTGETLLKTHYFYSALAQKMAISVRKPLLAFYPKNCYNTKIKPKKQFSIALINYKTGEIVDSISAGSDPELNPDSCAVSFLQFTPDGKQLFAIINTIDKYDYFGYPIYRPKLFFWNLSTGKLDRKYRPYLDNCYNFVIAPNGRYYLIDDKDRSGCTCFYDISSDKLIYYNCPLDNRYDNGFLLPNDTSHILICNDYKFKFLNASNFNIEKEIQYDYTLFNSYPKLAQGIKYYIYIDTKYNLSVLEFDLMKVVYRYAPLDIVNFEGYLVSNDSKFIFLQYTYNLIMLNAKYETTSVNNPDNEEPLLISPNPSSDFIEISVGAGSKPALTNDVRIYNIFGQIQTTPSLRDTPPYEGGEKYKIDVSALVPGMYFVRIGDKVGKFLKF